MPDQYRDTLRAQRLMPYAAKYESFPRWEDYLVGQSYLQSQRQSFTAIYMDADTVVSSVTIRTGSAMTTPANQWMSIYSEQTLRLAVSEDRLTEAWGSGTLKTFNFSPVFTTPYSGIYYVGLMVNAAAVGTIISTTTVASDVNLLPPVIGWVDNGNTSLTTPADAPAGPLTISGQNICAWFFVS